MLDGAPFPPLALAAEAFVVGSCITGDTLLQQSFISQNVWIRAFTDSLTHGLVALFSWFVVRSSLRWSNLVEAFLCMFLAMLVDTDHFIAAHSFHLNAALSLRQRPPFHNSTVIILVTLLLFMLTRTLPTPPYSVRIHDLPWIFLVAWMSHHLRDATRRGLWFWPVGSTLALPWWMYVTTTMLLPAVVKLAMVSMSETSHEHMKKSANVSLL